MILNNRFTKKIAMAVFAITFSISGMAQTFYFQTYQPKVDKKLFQQCGKKCPKLDYQLINTGHDWIDAVINKDIAGSFVLFEDADINQYQQTWQQLNQSAIPTKQQYEQFFNQAVKVLIAEHKTILAEEDNDTDIPKIMISVEPKYLGQRKHLQQIQLDNYLYSGGVHGIHFSGLYVFDMQKKKELTLDDILVNGKQKAKLEKLAKEQFIQYLKKEEVDPKEHLAVWEFHLTDNFVFDKQGLRLLYQPYEIGYYALGMPELLIPYRQLSGIVRAEYL